MMLGLLMARVGERVTLFEAQQDFDRDFRGDTVHAATLEVLDQIGLAERALQIPHAKLHSMSIRTPQHILGQFDLSRLPTKFPFVAVMPQADFLEFLCNEAQRYPNFECKRLAPVIGLLHDDNRVTGVKYRTDGEVLQQSASLIVAANGRFSNLRKLGNFAKPPNQATIDVCWLRVPKAPQDQKQEAGLVISNGHILVALERADSWQLGYVFPKGDFMQLREQGLAALQCALQAAAPWLGERVQTIDSWAKVHLLSVGADCLDTWHKPGLLMLGDAAHVMSPIGGVGINMAIGDAVEAANVLASPRFPRLAQGPVDDSVLAQVQKRRALATRIVQTMQAGIQQTITQRVLSGQAFDLPLPAKVLLNTPLLRDLPPRIIGLGFPKSRLQLN